MEVYLVRHGQPFSAEEDPERRLNSYGVEQCRLTGTLLKQLNLSADVLFCSPKARARQTADIISNSISYPPEDINVTPMLEPNAPASLFVKHLQTYNINDRVLIAGHLPSLSNIVSTLLNKTSSITIHFEPSSICRVDIGNISIESGTIRWLLMPEHIRMMTGNFNF